MAAAVRSAVTTVEALPTPRKMRAGVIRAPPPMPVRPTMVPTKNAAAMIEKNSEVSQLPMGAVLPGKVGQDVKVYRLTRYCPKWTGSNPKPLHEHLEERLHGGR